MTSPGRYILIGQTPVPEPDLLTWGLWLENADRIVARTEIPGGIVSTVFLGLDHNFAQTGPPILFETMVFMDGESDIDVVRYATWAEAEYGHQRMVEKFTVQHSRKKKS